MKLAAAAIAIIVFYFLLRSEKPKPLPNFPEDWDGDDWMTSGWRAA